MMKLNYISIVLMGFFAFTISCTKKSEKIKLTSDHIEILNANKNSQSQVNFELRKYIKLEITPNSMFTQIDKIKIRNNRIYILDKAGKNYLFVFDIKGKFLQRVGRIGHGPGEYNMICDFDIDENNQIIFYNRQYKKIMIYSSEGIFLKEVATLFRADGFNILREKKYIFSLKKDNELLKNNPKVVVTDSLMKIENKYFSYDSDNKDNKGTTNLFCETQDGLIYNKPVDNNLHIFNWNGELVKTYHVDFGAKSLPQKYINDFMGFWMLNEHNYNYINRTPLMISNLIVGIMTTGTKKATFIFNLDDKGIQVNELLPDSFSHKQLTVPLCLFNDSTIVSYLDYETYSYSKDKDEISNSLSSYLKEGGIALALFEIE